MMTSAMPAADDAPRLRRALARDAKEFDVIEPPPRNTSKARLPDECVLQRSCFNRSKIFAPNADEYREMRSMASITQHVDRVSRFHSLGALNCRTAADFRSTQICCWHDSSPFDGPVVALPKSFDTHTQSFVVYGCFCSVACAAGHLLEQTGFETTSQLLLLDRMAREVYGVTEYVPAPPRLALEMYGGPYSLERFRALSGGGEALMISPPFVSTYMVVEERDVGAHHISSLGLNGIGTVRGLRRPVEAISIASQETPECSPYLDFLASKGVATAAARPMHAQVQEEPCVAATEARFAETASGDADEPAAASEREGAAPRNAAPTTRRPERVAPATKAHRPVGKARSAGPVPCTLTRFMQ